MGDPIRCKNRAAVDETLKTLPEGVRNNVIISPPRVTGGRYWTIAMPETMTQVIGPVIGPVIDSNETITQVDPTETPAVVIQQVEMGRMLALKRLGARPGKVNLSKGNGPLPLHVEVKVETPPPVRLGPQVGTCMLDPNDPTSGATDRAETAEMEGLVVIPFPGHLQYHRPA